MNWYKKSMPLPRVKFPDAENFRYPSEIADGQEFYELMSNRVGEDLGTDPEGVLEYIGGGSYGLAFQSEKDPNKVVKFTEHKDEYEAAQMMMEWQKSNHGFHPHVVGVYEADIVPSSEIKVLNGKQPPAYLYRIVTEKVLPKQRVRMDMPRAPEINYQQNYDFKSSLRELGLSSWDLHDGNIGVRPSTGEIVVLDLGGLGAKK
jgi:hypothetical protein